MTISKNQNREYLLRINYTSRRKQKMNEEKKKDLPVFSQYIAAQLLLNGFRLHNISRNHKYNDKTVFYFRDCKEVRDIIEKVKKDLVKTEM